MDSLNLFNIKAEKANAMLRHSQLRRVASLLRLVEAVIVLVLVSRLSLNIPHAVKNSGGFLKDLSAGLLSPRFVFVLCNLIVGVLFAKSGQFSPKKLPPGHDDDLYAEFLRSSSEKKTAAATRQSSDDNSEINSNNNGNKSTFVRTKSEVFPAGRATRSNRVLRRSETEKFGNNNCKLVTNKYAVKVEKKKKCLYPEDLMSGEEFRLKVEAFIARQQRFRMEEEFSGHDLD